MSAINWNDGRLINLKGGDTATCAGELNPGQTGGSALGHRPPSASTRLGRSDRGNL
jgi:hypothetical protein